MPESHNLCKPSSTGELLYANIPSYSQGCSINSKLVLGLLAAEDVGNLAAQSLEDIDRLRWFECLGCALSLGPNLLDSAGAAAGQNHGGEGLGIDWGGHHHLWWNHNIDCLGISGRLDTSSSSRLGSNLLGRSGQSVGGLISDWGGIKSREGLSIICDVCISCTVHHRIGLWICLVGCGISHLHFRCQSGGL